MHHQKMHDIKEETLTFLTKWWSYIFYVMIGVMGKFSFDIVKRKKISIWYIIGATGVACFIGFLASMWCEYHYKPYAPYIVPIATLCSDKILMYIATLNWKPVLDSIYGVFTKNK